MGVYRKMHTPGFFHHSAINVSATVKRTPDTGTHQGYRSERVEAIEHEISVGCLQIVVGRGKRGLECPFLLANP